MEGWKTRSHQGNSAENCMFRGTEGLRKLPGRLRKAGEKNTHGETTRFEDRGG